MTLILLDQYIFMKAQYLLKE